MSNKNIIRLKSKPYIIQNKGFSTIDFVFLFPYTYDKSYMFYLKLMRQFILSTSKNYKEEKEYRKEYIDSMIINMKMQIKILNENLFILTILTVPNPEILKSYDLERAFKFFIEAIYNPNVDKDKFNEKVFLREKEYLTKSILSKLKNVYTKTYQSFINLTDDSGILKDNIYNNMNLIDESTPKELYEVYKKLIINNKPAIFVYGDIKDDIAITKMIEKYIKVDAKNIEFTKNYTSFLIPFESLKYKEEDSTYKESVIYVAYKIKDAKEEDMLYLNVIKNILGVKTDSLIFKKIRIDNGLAYSVSAWSDRLAGLLVIETYINKTSKDKVLNSIEEVIKNLNNEKFLKERLDKLIKDIKVSTIREKDNKNVKLNDFINKKIEIGVSTEDLIKMYEEIDILKLLDFVRRLKLDTIYFSKGEFNEE